jgi:hypothetical protein
MLHKETILMSLSNDEIILQFLAARQDSLDQHEGLLEEDC